MLQIDAYKLLLTGEQILLSGVEDVRDEDWFFKLDSREQLLVSIAAVLTLIAYHIALTGKLPDIPYLTRMDLFLFGSTLLVFSSLLEVVLTSRLAKAERLDFARRVDGASRLLFPLVYLLIAYLALIAGLGASM